MKIAFFGGSFDPPHIAHELIVKKALEKLDVDKLIVMPSFLNPFKTRSVATPAMRLKWMRKIFKGADRVVVDDFESTRGKPTPSIESIRYLKEKLHPSHIYLIIGADNLPKLSKWDSFDALSREVEFVIATRDAIAIDKKYKTLNIKEGISSSRIRDESYFDEVPASIRDEVSKIY